MNGLGFRGRVPEGFGELFFWGVYKGPCAQIVLYNFGSKVPKEGLLSGPGI